VLIFVLLKMYCAVMRVKSLLLYKSLTILQGHSQIVNKSSQNGPKPWKFHILATCIFLGNHESTLRSWRHFQGMYMSVPSPVIQCLRMTLKNLEKVQRKFTQRRQRLPGLWHLTCCQRLARLQLESTELRRVAYIRFDLVFA